MKKLKLIIAFSILLFALLLLGVVIEGDWLQDKFPSLPTLTDIIGGDTVITSRDGTLSKLAKLARKAVKTSRAGLRRGWRLKEEKADKEAAGKREDFLTFAKSIGVATEPVSTKKSTEKAAVTSHDVTISTSDTKTTPTMSTAKPKDKSFWAFTTTRQPASTPTSESVPSTVEAASSTSQPTPSSETTTGGEESAPTSEDTTPPSEWPPSDMDLRSGEGEEGTIMPPYEDWLQRICLCLSQELDPPMTLDSCAIQVSNNLDIPLLKFNNYIEDYRNNPEADYPLCCNFVYMPTKCCKYSNYFKPESCCLTDDDCAQPVDSDLPTFPQCCSTDNVCVPGPCLPEDDGSVRGPVTCLEAYECHEPRCLDVSSLQPCQFCSDEECCVMTKDEDGYMIPSCKSELPDSSDSNACSPACLSGECCITDEETGELSCKLCCSPECEDNQCCVRACGPCSCISDNDCPEEQPSCIDGWCYAPFFHPGGGIGR